MQNSYITVGEITLDDTVLETGELRRDQTGGGAVYSALGIRLWGHKVGIHATIGEHYPQQNLETLSEHQVATEGITRIPGWGLRLWLLHEENNKKQQVPKLQSSSFAYMDDNRPDPPSSYLRARGYHLAPATPEGQIRARDFLRSARPDALLSLDMLAEPFVNLELYRSGAALRGIDIFSPSIVEIEKLWPDDSMETIMDRLDGFGIRWIAIKMDERGALVCDTAQGHTVHIPIYPASVADTTGAGDAFSGGFLAGLAQTANVYEAGLQATVAASFAVERWGAFSLLSVTKEEADERYLWLQARQ